MVDEAVCAYRIDPTFRATVDRIAPPEKGKTDADRVAASCDEETTTAHLDVVLGAFGAPAEAARLAREVSVFRL